MTDGAQARQKYAQQLLMSELRGFSFLRLEVLVQIPLG
jgi:hypothetical protein